MEFAGKQTFVSVLFSPLERIQAIQQFNCRDKSSYGIYEVFKQIRDQDGVSGFWRGTPLMAFQYFGVAAIQILGKRPSNKYTERPSNLTNITTNAIANIFSIGFVFASNNIYASLLVHPTRIDFISLAQQIYSKKGFFGFFSGISASLLTSAVTYSSSIICAGLGTSSALINIYVPLLVAYPFNTIRNAVVTQDLPFMQIVKEAGVKGLYKGVGTALLLATLDVLIWDFIHKYYDKKDMD